jgi:hypothetical protein
MRVLILLLPLVLHLLQLCHHVDAMLARPTPFEEVQPDGTKITLRMIGDERYHSLIHVDNGFPVVKDEATKWFQYANRESEQTALKVGVDDPASAEHAHLLLTKHTAKGRAKKCKDAQKECIGSEADVAHHRSLANLNLQKTKMQINSFTGTLPNLMIAIKFSDHTTRTLPSQADLQILMNNDGPDATRCPTGSVRDVRSIIITSFDVVCVNVNVLLFLPYPIIACMTKRSHRWQYIVVRPSIILWSE